MNIYEQCTDIGFISWLADTSVGTVTATDADLESANNQITYSLSGKFW